MTSSILPDDEYIIIKKSTMEEERKRYDSEISDLIDELIDTDVCLAEAIDELEEAEVVIAAAEELIKAVPALIQALSNPIVQRLLEENTVPSPTGSREAQAVEDDYSEAAQFHKFRSKGKE